MPLKLNIKVSNTMHGQSATDVMLFTSCQNCLLPGGNIHCVSEKNVTTLSCYNFDKHESILIVFGKNVTEKVSNQKTLYFPISSY